MYTASLTAALLGGGLVLLLLGTLGGGRTPIPSPSGASGGEGLPSPLSPLAAQFDREPEGVALRMRLLHVGTQPAGPEGVSVDGREVLTWEAQPEIVSPGGELLLTVRYPFRSGRSYAIAIRDTLGRLRTLSLTAPALPSGLTLRSLRVERTSGEPGLRVELELQAAGYERLTLLVEVWADYEPASKGEREPIYVLSEPLGPEAEAYREAFLRWAERLDPPLRVEVLDRKALAELSEARTPGVVIVFTPLLGHRGPVKDALPIELLGPATGSGGSAGLSHLRRWIREGLVLVTPTTTHPMRALLRSDGRTQSPVSTAVGPGLLLLGKLSTWWSMTARLTHEGAPARALLWGRYQGEYGGVAEFAGEALYGYREFENTFSQGPPEVRGRTLHLYNPFFLRSGRGGWLALAHSPPSPETLGHDLALLLVHAPWRGRWPTSPAAERPSWAETRELRGGALSIRREVWLRPPSDAEGRLVRLLVFAEDDSQEPSRWLWREWVQRLPVASEAEARSP